MGEWFNQARFDLNELSTKGLIEFVKGQVDTARLFVGSDYHPRPPEELRREARADVESLFRDKPAAAVLIESGQSRDAVLRALDTGKFEAVLSGLDQAVRYGSERELPAAAALAAPAIEAQARYNAAGQKRDAAITAGEPRRPISEAQVPAVRQRLADATKHATAIIQSGTSQKEALNAVDRARSYWDAAADSGRKINSAAKPVESNEKQVTQGRGQSRAR